MNSSFFSDSFRVALVISALVLTGCSASFKEASTENPAQTQRSLDSYLSVYAAAAPADLAADDPLEYVSRRVELNIATVPQCVAGEMDILKYAHQCAADVPILITVADAVEERVVARRSTTRIVTFNQLMMDLSTHRQQEIRGADADIFICIDGNGDGRCADEPVKDVNAVSGMLAPIMKAANTAKAANLNCNPALTQMIRSGMVMYHRHHQFDGVESQVSQQASAFMRANVRSLSDATDVNTQSDGSTKIRLSMVQFDQTTCPPPPKVRTNGCFARETRVLTERRGEVQIDLLMPGEKVVLADGRRGAIQKIIAGPEKLPLVVFETSTGEKIRLTTTHPMQTDTGIKQAVEISIGDRLQLAGGRFVALKKITREAYADVVYNVELQGAKEADHLLIANGLVSGDLFIQQTLTNRSESKLSLLEEAQKWIESLTVIESGVLQVSSL